MSRHPHLIALESLEGIYGPMSHRGILVDRLPEVAQAGLVVRPGQRTDWVASPSVTTRAVPLLCGHLVEWTDEDGLRDGFCGRPIVAGGNGCPIHHMDLEADCEHGMAASLCAGPGHYPQD